MSKKKDVIFTSPRGGKYEGEYKDGKRHGQGKLTYPDGRKFVGEWKDGEPIGQGTFTWSNGDKYVGEFKDGKNMVKGHTLNLREGSMQENGRMEKDGTEHSMTKKEKSLESL